MLKSVFRHRPALVAALWLATPATGLTADEFELDLDTLCYVDAPTAAKVIAYWGDADGQLIKAGMDAAEDRECVLTLLPEALADIVLGRSPEFGKAAEVSVLLPGLGASDITADLRAMPLYASVELALDTGDFSRDAVLRIVGQTAIAESAVRAKDEGRTREGSKLTVSFVALRHDGVFLMLIAE